MGKMSELNIEVTNALAEGIKKKDLVKTLRKAKLYRITFGYGRKNKNKSNKRPMPHRRYPEKEYPHFVP